MPRGRWVILVLLVLTAVLPGWAEAPHLRGQGSDVPWSKGPGGVMLYFEDESFEDCGLIVDGKRLADAQCADVWQPALPRPVATVEACQMLLGRYTHAAEDFRCSRERPEPLNDDFADPSPGRH